jgi:predicted nucleic acid-binding protein
MSDRLILLDACAVVGLYATRRMDEIITVLGNPVAVVGIVANESQYVFRGGDGDDAHDREPIDLVPIVTAGVLSIVSTGEEEELQTFIDLTQELDDGEAMTAALAIHRRAVVATDDRKAERVLTERGVPIRCTLDLIKTWTDQERLSPPDIRQILIDLRQRATYEPRRTHPFRPWWDSILSIE